MIYNTYVYGLFRPNDWDHEFEFCIQQSKTTCLLSVRISLACARASKLTTTKILYIHMDCSGQMTSEFLSQSIEQSSEPECRLKTKSSPFKWQMLKQLKPVTLGFFRRTNLVSALIDEFIEGKGGHEWRVWQMIVDERSNRWKINSFNDARPLFGWYSLRNKKHEYKIWGAPSDHRMANGDK